MNGTSRVTFLLVALATSAAGCGGNAGVAGGKFVDQNPLPPDTMIVAMHEVGHYGGRFVIAQTSGPKTFNGPMANETSSTDVTRLLYTGLVNYDNASQSDVPALAKSWESSADGLTWTWHLRRGACFSDGHPITADDVLFSFEVAQDSIVHPAIRDLLIANGRRVEVSAPDSYTVVTKLPAVRALVLSTVGSVLVLPKHVLEAPYRNGTFAATYSVSTAPESLVTSGAWRVKQYVAQEKTVLARNPYWFGVDAKGQRLPYLDELVFQIVPDQNTASLKFQSGEVDGLDNVKPEDYAAYERDQSKGNYTLYELGPSLTTNFVFFNLNRVRAPRPGKKLGEPCAGVVKYAWFSNVTFRRAVSHAIDRDAIAKSVLFSEGVKNWSTTTAGNKKWYSPSIVGADYDTAEAKRMLASLGWKDRDHDGVLEDTGGHPIQFTMLTNADNVVRVAMMNFVRDDLAKVGIRCVPTPMDFNTTITKLRESFDYDAVLLGGSGGVPPDLTMGQNVLRSSGPTHYWNVRQPKPETAAEARIDQLLAENVSSLDDAERHRTGDEIQRIINEQVFLVWLPSAKIKVPVRNTFGNVEPVIIPHRILWNIDRVYWKGGAKRS
jgi:peptide/nickel transport system substrate-binding protein